MSETPSLFEADDASRPLAVRLRPRTLQEVVGQDHLLAVDAPIGWMVDTQRLVSMVLWGPPGCSVGATTENPSFELNGALLSRCQVFVLKRLDDAALNTLITRAEEIIGRPLPLTDEAREALTAMADGDGRYLLNMIEQIHSMPGALTTNWSRHVTYGQ